MAMSLDHPSDPNHALFLQELSENFSAACHICKLHCSGPTCCCWDCDIFVHKSCAEELPLEACHPDHPHPLLLSVNEARYAASIGGHCPSDEYEYKCESCDFRVDATWKFVIPQDGREMMRHAAHEEHPLIPFLFHKPIKVKCRACKLQISETGQMPFYGCLFCSFYLHESCARLATQLLRHPLYPQRPLCVLVGIGITGCGACGSPLSSRWDFGFSYCCTQCIFQLDFQCATLFQNVEDPQWEDCETTLQFFYRHFPKSFSVRAENVGIQCEACNLSISGQVCCFPKRDGVYFLHKSCTDELTKDMVHHLHPQHPLVFFNGTPYSNGAVCDACQSKIHGFTFHCESCHFDLHFECAFLTFSASKEGIPTEILVTSGHLETFVSLTLLYMGRYKQSVSCDGCHEPLLRLAYSSHLHPNSDTKCLCMVCAKLPDELKHPSHPSHPLIFQLKREASVDVFGRKIEGFCFGCNECQFFLSVEDASRRPTLEYQPHEHSLTLFQRLHDSKCCHFCGKKCFGDSYCCLQCDYTVHYHCVRNLPLSIKHEVHFHPILLLDKHVEESHEEQYCDACEKTRRPDRGVYYCGECSFAAHIGCVIPWVESEETAPDKLKMLDDEISGLMTHIESTEMNIKAMMENLQESRDRLEKRKMERHNVALTLA